MVPKRAGGPGMGRDLGSGLKERQGRAGRILALPEVRGLQDLHPAGDGDAPDSLEAFVLSAASRRCRSWCGPAANPSQRRSGAGHTPERWLT